jgi:uncharacterized membrane protein
MVVSIVFFIPILITAVSFAWAFFPREDERPTGSMFDGLSMLGPLIRGLAALSVSLASWLVYALVL